MGLLGDLFARTPEKVHQPDVAASLAPYNPATNAGQYWLGNSLATREEAMSIPTIARARNLKCQTLASMHLYLWDESTGSKIYPPRVLNQPDERIPGSVFYAFIAEDLDFYGYAFAQVRSLYADTGRVRDMERIAPTRVTTLTNSLATEIDGYMVDGKAVPNTGLGSLVVFYGLDEGLLNRAGRTIKAGAALERAATIYAQEPYPTMVLKSTGTSLPADRVRQLLDGWRTARNSRSTAFLNADVTLESVGYDPKSLQLNEAREQVATELARACNVPAYFVDANSGSSMTYSNSTSERRSFVDFSLRPLLTAIEQRLNMSDITPAGQTVRFDMDDFLRGNPLERAQVYEILNRIGALSIEEIREEEDLIEN
jgi:HK97 family phage portal protein